MGRSTYKSARYFLLFTYWFRPLRRVSVQENSLTYFCVVCKEKKIHLKKSYLQSDYFNTILVSPEKVIEEGEKSEKGSQCENKQTC